jgi:hypothetical protein
VLIHLLGAVVKWTGLWVHISSQPDPAQEGLKQRGERGRGKEVLVHDALRREGFAPGENYNILLLTFWTNVK